MNRLGIVSIIVMGIAVAPFYAEDYLSFDATAPMRQAVYPVLFPRTEFQEFSKLRSFSELTQLLREEYAVAVNKGERYTVLHFSRSLDANPAEPGAGSYRLFYDQKLGDYTRIEIMVTHPSEFTLVSTIEAEGDRRYITVSVANNIVYKRIPTQLSLKKIFLIPFSTFVEYTKQRIDWDALLPLQPHTLYAPVRAMSGQIRVLLPSLPDAEDGAIDEFGNLVYIETHELMEMLPGFNCSGFGKWIVDGLVYPIQHRYLAIEPLKAATFSGTGLSTPFMESRDPYFGLDWTRNLSKAFYSLAGLEPHKRSFDVNDVPGSEYREHIGYPIHDLAKILYFLAQSEPGHWYLGSVNKQFGKTPVLRQHIHVLALFPYFDAAGRFHIDVFERNVESSLGSLESRYPSEFIHLVRVLAMDSFQPLFGDLMQISSSE